MKQANRTVADVFVLEVLRVAGRVEREVGGEFLVDRIVIEELYAASAAGVRIDLLVRGICCLRPEVPGLSENIRVSDEAGLPIANTSIYRTYCTFSG